MGRWVPLLVGVAVISGLALSGFFLLTSPPVAQQAAAQAPAPSETKSLKLYVVSAGYLLCDKSWVTVKRADIGVRTALPVPMYIVDHPKGLFIFDTGISPDIVNDPMSYWGKLVIDFYPTMRRDEAIDEQLKKLGFDPANVKLIAYSHVHPDHAGGMELFPKATHLVQAKDYEYIKRVKEGYLRLFMMPEDFDKMDASFQIKTLTGDLDVFGDGTVILYSTPGHTPGSQSCLVKLSKSGAKLIIGDAAYDRTNIDTGVLPYSFFSQDQGWESIQRIKKIAADEKAEIWIAHDVAQFKTVKQAPQYYD